MPVKGGEIPCPAVARERIKIEWENKTTNINNIGSMTNGGKITDMPSGGRANYCSLSRSSVYVSKWERPEG